MLADYVHTIPIIIAVINSVIAVGNSRFTPERNFLKITLLITAMALGVAAATAAIYGQHVAVERVRAEANRRHSIHDKLGDYISQDDQWLTYLRNQANPIQSEKIEAWNSATESI